MSLSRSTSVIEEENQSDKEAPTDTLQSPKLGFVSALYTFMKVDNSRLAIASSLVVVLIAQFLRHRTDLWIAEWSREKHEASGHSSFVISYSLLIVTTFLVICVEISVFFILGLRSARKLHDQAFSCLLNTKISFFERTSIGSTTNTFTNHTQQLDFNLPNAIANVVRVS